jgi:hypothetical protein
MCGKPQRGVAAPEMGRVAQLGERGFEMDLSKADIENGPEFDPEKPVNVEYEAQVYDYYGRPFDATIDKTAQQHIANPFV